MVNKLKRICLHLPGLSCSLLPLNSKALTLHQECQGLYYTDIFRFVYHIKVSSNIMNIPGLLVML